MRRLVWLLFIVVGTIIFLFTFASSKEDGIEESEIVELKSRVV